MCMPQEVVALMGIDLLRHREAWKGRWSAMKDMVTTQIKKRAYAPEHTSKWLMHWDYQVRYPAACHSMRSNAYVCSPAFGGGGSPLLQRRAKSNAPTVVSGGRGGGRV